MATDASVINQKGPLPALFGWLIANPVLVIGALSVLIPTLMFVARESWSTDQGAHGPIVLATGLWLLVREWQNARPFVKPAPLPLVLAVFIPAVLAYFVARVSGIVELEGFLMYATMVTIMFSVLGLPALKIMWFPLIYLLFVFPLPETIVSFITNPLKIALSTWAVDILYYMGYPIGAQGVVINVGQYELLVADACSGLNSLVSLSAIGLFYVYLRHHAQPRYALALFLTILPVAVFANLVRILILVLLTYHAGESAAQGFLHDFAGMTMFITALLTIFVIDHFLGRFVLGRPRDDLRPMPVPNPSATPGDLPKD